MWSSSQESKPSDNTQKAINIVHYVNFKKHTFLTDTKKALAQRDTVPR